LKLFGSSGKRNNRSPGGRRSKSRLLKRDGKKSRLLKMDGKKSLLLKTDREKSRLLKKENKKERSRNDNRKILNLNRKNVIYGSMIAVGVVLITVALRVIFGGLMEDSAARDEYDQLREYSPTIIAPAALNDIPVGDADEEEQPEDEEDEDEAVRELSFDELAMINRDFIGWISNGKIIDYPVVRGSDNNKYINTTFFGNRNTAGAIFMDYRNSSGFEGNICVLYGHNTRDGTMFAPLVNYLEPAYRRSNPFIYVTTRDGTMLTYSVFAAKITDAWDSAYALGITDNEGVIEAFSDAPSNARRILLLSTCTKSADEDERLLVFAALV